MRRNQYTTIKQSNIHGLGVFSNNNRYSGYIFPNLQYTGPIVPINNIDINNKYLLQISNENVIDGSSDNNTAKYINHSSSPNCIIYKQPGTSKYIVQALSFIYANEELLFDYGSEYCDYFNIIH